MSLPVPLGRTAHVHLLFAGYAESRVASTVTCVLDAERVIIVDPGMVPTPEAIVEPLSRLGVAPSGVSDVILSHHHPDHALNAGLFPSARVHDHWAIYQHDMWTSRPADGFALTESVRLASTPGHTRQDITTLIGTTQGLVACTHLWWSEAGPVDDPLAEDSAAIHHWRAQLLALPDLGLVVPGHGVPFVPTPQTVR
jgi:glyoxylase-like metal-dependent hydrolase (beta-lactamase superfamily II)